MKNGKKNAKRSMILLCSLGLWFSALQIALSDPITGSAADKGGQPANTKSDGNATQVNKVYAKNEDEVWQEDKVYRLFDTAFTDGVAIKAELTTTPKPPDFEWILTPPTGSGATIDSPGDLITSLTDIDVPGIYKLQARCSTADEGKTLSIIITKVKSTAYRPTTEGPAYGSPFAKTEVPDDQEESPGAGIRANGDDDNGNGTPDCNESSVTGENDLIELVLEVGIAPAPSGLEYVLRRSSNEICVWDSQTKETAILNTGTEATVAFTSTTRTVWVECRTGGLSGAADLDFVARATATTTDVCTDKIHFYQFTSIVIGLSGEVSAGGSPYANGMYNVATALYQAGYDVHYYDEDVVGADGSGDAYDEVVSAIGARGVETVAIYGHSHGGGSTYDLAERLDGNRTSIGTFSISFTGYVDAIENDGYADTDSESRRPPSTSHHMNYYQPIGWLHGVPVAGANTNLDVTTTTWGAGLDHTSIDNNNTVITHVSTQLRNKTNP